MYVTERTSRMLQMHLEDIMMNDKFRIQNAIISIVRVQLSSNFSNLNVFFSFLSQRDPNELLEQLEARKVQIRHLLASKVRNKMRRIPVVNFYLDTSVKDAFVMDEIIKRL